MSIRRWLTILCTLWTFAALDRAYSYLIAPLFGYYGLNYKEFSLSQTLITFAMAAIPLLWLKLESLTPRDFILYGIYLLVVVPTALFAAHISNHNFYDVMTFVGYLLASFYLSFVFSNLPDVKFSIVSAKKSKSLLNLVVFILLVGEGLCFLYFGASFANISRINFENLYEIREEMGAMSVTAPIILLYFISWSGNVTNPFLIVYGLSRKSKFLVVSGFAAQFLLGVLTGSKVVFLIPVMAMGLYFIIRRYKNNLTLLIAGFSLALILVMTWIGTALSALPIRRVYLNAGLITTRYFDFFFDRVKAHYADGPLKSFFYYPYDRPIPQLIGQTYFPIRLKANANANYLAESYANIGIEGMLGISIVLGLLLWLWNGFAKGKDEAVILALSLIFISSLSNSGFFTNLLTHGLGLMLLLISLLPEKPTTLKE